MDNKPKVSIIIPIYNCENRGYLNQIIGDVLNQTEHSFELILCDDGSTDKTVEIAEKFLAEDSRIKLVKNVHQGVSATRNSGLKVAQGQWVTFVDADDSLLPNFLKSLTEGLDDDADLVYGGYAIVNTGGLSIYTYNQQVYRGFKQVKSLLETTNVLYRCSPWAKLFKREIIQSNNLKFDETLPHSEDRLFLYQYLMHVTCIKTTSEIGYLYANFNSNSLKNKKLPWEVINYRQKVITENALAVINHFELDSEGIYNIGLNLINLKNASLQLIYDEYGFGRQTVTKQRAFIETHFADTVVNTLLKNKKLSAFLPDSQRITPPQLHYKTTKKSLWKANIHRLFIDWKIQVFSILNRHRNIPKNFANYVFKLN